MDRPTREQIDRARKWLDAEQIAEIGVSMPITAEMVDILVAATAPPPDVPRPANMAELAQAVARELRAKGIWVDVWPPSVICYPRDSSVADGIHHLTDEKFDNLSVTEIAALIQTKESKRAKEWAGDE
jgi:hypothetical protein